MRTVHVLAIAALVLGLMAPAVAAANGVDLTRSATGDRSLAVANGRPVDQFETYTVQLSRSMPLILASRVSLGSTAVDHEATWSIDGVSGTSTRVASAKTGTTVSAGSHSLSISWHLAGQTPAGTYSLLAFVREDVGSSGGGAGGTAAADTDSMNLVLTRTAASGPDDSAPTQVTGLATDFTGETQILLRWEPADDDQGVVRYDVFRSTDPAFAANADSLVATPSETSWTDSGLSRNTLYHYRVRAVDGAGNVGPVSALLAVRTLPGPDTVAPTAVGGLEVTTVTNDSIAIAWAPASDDRGPLSYEVHRGSGAGSFTPSAATRIATVNTLAYTSSGLAASTTYTFVVRAVDAGGNPGPSSSTSAQTLAVADLTPPAVTGLAVHQGTTTFLTWSTDEPADSTLTLSGPGGAQTVPSGHGVQFRATVGALAPGTYEYTITAVDRAGNSGEASGAFVADTSGGVGTAASKALVDDLHVVLETSTGQAGLFLVDSDGDGRVDAVRDSEGLLTTVHVAASEGLFLLLDAQGGKLALINAFTQTAVGVATAAGSVGSERATSEVISIPVTVTGASGWTLVTIPDDHPDHPIVGVRRADGTLVPLERVWRSDGTIKILDESPYSLSVIVDNAAGSPASLAPAHPANPWPVWMIAAVAVASMGLGILVTFVLLRRR